MDVLESFNGYVELMVGSISGMKILLLDNETTSYLSTTTTQSHLLTKEVYLIDKIERRDSEKLTNLKCIILLRPTSNSIFALKEELHKPRFSEYYLYFTNILRKSTLEDLASVDTKELVRSVKEVFADFLPLDKHLYSLGITSNEYKLFEHSFQGYDKATLQRTVQGVFAVLLALKKKPIIRYCNASDLARILAEEVKYQMDNETQLFRFPKEDSPPLLLILDRKSDPVTPLLTQWTYQAMIHEELTINNGRVDLSSSPSISPELKEIVVNASQDSFYKTNLMLNFGDLGTNIKAYVDEYQVKTKSQAKVESIEDMRNFVDSYPEFRKLAGNVTKHVALVSELSTRVDQNRLLEVSELEQSLACNETWQVDFKTLIKLIQDPGIKEMLKIRLACLYFLRYEKSNNLNYQQVLSALKQANISSEKIKIIDKMMEFAGFDQRQNDLYGDSNIFSKGRNVIKGLQGVENVYTQHTPHLYHTIEDLLKGKLKDTTHPFLKSNSSRLIPQDIIIYQIGGTTYAEANAMVNIMKKNPGVRIVLGGDQILNSSLFIKRLD